MSQTLTLLMAQINPKVGAVEDNTQKIINIIQTYQVNHDVIIFPELAITGYPPEDLLLRPALFVQVEQALCEIQKKILNSHVIIGHPSYEQGQCFNTASILTAQGQVARYHKQWLPNYGVFDEARYFHPGPAKACTFTIKNYKLGLCICEDIWKPGPIEQLIAKNTEVLICINASPFESQKYQQREKLLQPYAQQGLTIVYVNQCGGQDELVFDGQSFVMNTQGTICARASAFLEEVQSVTVKSNCIEGTLVPLLENESLIYQALVLGLRDYVEKNNFPGVLLGLSGGIDSALTLCIAVDALGPARVHAVLMPSRYTADMSIEDAQNQAQKMQVDYTILPIESLFEIFLQTLSPAIHNSQSNVMQENLQARIRGNLLMALSNQTGSMVLTTGNKSEIAVGYCTLYGDMVGGFAVLKDILKTQVYNLAHYRNTISPVIPARVLTRAPSAELAPNQTDQDNLPDYSILDAIITLYMEQLLSAEDIIKQGYSPKDVTKTLQLIRRNEYKRKQSVVGVKVSPCSFGRDWRYPITSGFTCKIAPKR